MKRPPTKRKAARSRRARSDGISERSKSRSKPPSTALAVPVPRAELVRPDDTEDIVEQLLRRKAKLTMKTYWSDYQDFTKYRGRNPRLEPEVYAALGELLRASHGDANRLASGYRVHLASERGLAAATVNRRLCALRSIVREARRFGTVSWTLDVEGMRSKAYRDTTGPGVEAIAETLERLRTRLAEAEQAKPGSSKAAKAARDIAIIRLMADLGLRRIEVQRLDLAHIELGKSRIWVLGKARDQLEPITIAPETRGALMAWLEYREREPGPLICSMHRGYKGKRITIWGISAVVRGLGSLLKIRMTGHGIRHTAITEALEDDSITDVQAFARHSDPRVTSGYDDRRRDRPQKVSRKLAKKW